MWIVVCVSEVAGWVCGFCGFGYLVTFRSWLFWVCCMLQFAVGVLVVCYLFAVLLRFDL